MYILPIRFCLFTIFVMRHKLISLSSDTVWYILVISLPNKTFVFYFSNECLSKLIPQFFSPV